MTGSCSSSLENPNVVIDDYYLPRFSDQSIGEGGSEQTVDLADSIPFFCFISAFVHRST